MIREAKKEELKEIAAMVEKEFHTKWNLQNDLQKAYLYLEEEILGFLIFSSLYDHFDMDYIYVNEKYRRKGIARKLVLKMLKEGEKDSVKRITLEVSEKNQNAVLFYQKMGFQVVAKRKNYYRDSDALLMVLEIGEV